MAKSIILKGTIQEVMTQWQSLMSYYGENATVKEIIENESAISQNEVAND